MRGCLNLVRIQKKAKITFSGFTSSFRINIKSMKKSKKSVHLHYFLRCGRKTLKGQFRECKRLNFTGYKKHCIQKRMQIIAFTRITHGLNLEI